MEESHRECNSDRDLRNSIWPAESAPVFIGTFGEGWMICERSAPEILRHNRRTVKIAPKGEE
jgi:hypothetical protein